MELLAGDLTRASVDGVIDSANSAPAGGGRVDGAIGTAGAGGETGLIAGQGSTFQVKMYQSRITCSKANRARIAIRPTRESRVAIPQYAGHAMAR